MEGNLSLWSHLSLHQLDHTVSYFIPTYYLEKTASQKRAWQTKDSKIID